MNLTRPTNKLPEGLPTSMHAGRIEQFGTKRNTFTIVLLLIAHEICLIVALRRLRET